MASPVSIPFPPDGETAAQRVGRLEAELAAARQELHADPVATRAREALRQSDDPQVIAAVERQSATAQQADG